MRKLALLSSPVLVAALVFACDDDSSPAATANLQDAGGVDANTPPPQPGTDAAVQDSGPLPVTVAVKDITGAPVANVTVVFHDATGAVLSTVPTASDGIATSTPTPTPAMATVVFGPDTTDRQVLTWTGVEAGDVLPVVAPIPTTLAEFKVTLPGVYDGQNGTTVGYNVQVGDCEFNTPNLTDISVPVTSDCFTGAGAVLVQGHADVEHDEAVLAFTSKKGVSFATDGGTVAVTTEAWVAPPTDVTVTLQNPPNLEATTEVWFSQITNQTAFFNRTGLDENQAVFHAAGGTFSEAYNASVVYWEDGTTRIVGKRVAPATAISLDAAGLPTKLTAAAVTNTATDRPTANWTGNMTGMKGGIVRLDWYGGDDKATHWSIVVPANTAETGTVTAPALPATLANIVPQADGGSEFEWQVTPEVDFVDSDLLPDYATWRKLQGVVFTTTVMKSGRLERVVLPQAGSFKITSRQMPR